MKTVHCILIVAALLPSAAACSDQDPSSLHIEANAVPKREGAVCSLGDAQKVYAEGFLDLAVTDEYIFNMVIRNLLPETLQFTGNGEKELRPEYNTINLDFVEITPEYQPTAKSPWAEKVTGLAALPPPTWNVPVSRKLAPAGADRLPMYMVAVPARITIGTKLTDVGRDWRARWQKHADKYKARTRITLKMRAHGHTQAGHDVVSEVFNYPLTVCWGCLVFLPDAMFVPSAESEPDFWRMCSTGVWPTEIETPCVIGNNEFVPCGMYCWLCKNAKFQGKQFLNCDDKFCPAALQ
jgi:hypothetical protein